MGKDMYITDNKRDSFPHPRDWFSGLSGFDQGRQHQEG
ncbi:MAG: hypothetical protein RL648_1497 [Verrucomicrobiota bacterium]